MNTDDLIAELAQAAGPVDRTALPRRALAGLGLGLAGSAVLFALFYGPRPGLAAELADPVIAAKTVLPLILGLLALPLTLAASRPAATAAPGLRAIWLVPVAVAALVVFGYATTAPGARLAAFIGHSIPVCLPSIPLLSAPVGLLLIRALRSGAPVHPAWAGALAGLTAAGFGTAIYSLFCTENSPLFYGVWYPLGVLISMGLGAAAGARLLRW